MALEQQAPFLLIRFVLSVVFGAQGHNVFPTSWWRSARQNERVGGDAESQHLLGLALDLVSDEPAELVASLREMGLTAVDEGDHVHVQALKAGEARRQGLLGLLG